MSTPLSGSPEWLRSLARDSFIEGSGLAAGLRAAAEWMEKAEARLIDYASQLGAAHGDLLLMERRAVKAEAERDRLREDKERLDWLEADPYVRGALMRTFLPIVPRHPGPGQVRASIDSAMSSARKEGA